MTPSEAHSPTALPFGATGLVGQVLAERYRIEALLGEGGMGAVYLAEHLLMRKRFALKVLHSEMTRMPEIVARFEREAMAAAHIEHPNVAAATDFGKLDDGTFFLVLEYVEGTSLRDALAKGPFAVERTLHIAHQIASALARAHALGIVHRDLKPDNVMLVDRDGDTNFVKVLDFGIAKVPMGELPAQHGGSGGQVLTQLGMVYGTPEYMAPEQALGQPVDGRADLYAVGVMMFEMLTGARPFEAPTIVALLGAKVTSDPPSLASKNPAVAVGAAVQALVRALLDKEAALRVPSAHELMDAIDACRASAAPVPSSARYRRSLASVERAGVAATVAAADLATTGPGAPLGVVDRARGAGAGFAARLTALRGLPPVFWVAASGVTIVLLVGLALSRAHGSSKQGPPSAGPASSAESTTMFRRWLAPATAPGDRLASAVGGGAAALQDLATSYPDDPAVWRALVRAFTKEKRSLDAVSAVAKLVARDERAAAEEDVRDALGSAAAGPPDAANAAFALMESAMGGQGPDVMFELLGQKGSPARLTARLKQSLARPETRAKMSPALAVALDFRSASGCDARKALLPRVKEQGDARLLPTLRSMQAGKGCGFLGLADCWGCLRRDGALGAAQAALEDRAAR